MTTSSSLANKLQIYCRVSIKSRIGITIAIWNIFKWIVKYRFSSEIRCGGISIKAYYVYGESPFLASSRFTHPVDNHAIMCVACAACMRAFSSIQIVDHIWEYKTDPPPKRSHTFQILLCHAKRGLCACVCACFTTRCKQKSNETKNNKKYL